MRKKCRVHRNRANVAQYRKLQEKVTDMITAAEYQWWLSECAKLTDSSEGEKWRRINRLTN